MAIDFVCCADTALTVVECKKLLMRELGLTVSTQKPNSWLINEGTTVTVQNVADVFGRGRVEREIFGFNPRITIEMRPVLSGPYSELGSQTIMKTVDSMLRNTDGDVGFSVENERALLVRRDGVVYVRDNFVEHLRAENLELITVPYQFKPLRP